jgi:hypothetical protein
MYCNITDNKIQPLPIKNLGASFRGDAEENAVIDGF